MQHRVVRCKPQFDVLDRFHVEHSCDGRTDGRTDGIEIAIAVSDDIHTCEVTVAPARLDMPQSALRPAAIAGPVRCPWCVQ